MTSRAWLVTLIPLTACGGGSSTPAPDAGPPGPSAVAHFDPPAPGAGGDWGQVPYPSDLYLDGSGKLALTTLPAGADADPAAVTNLRDGLATMTGAGLRSNVYFPIDLDPGVDLDPDTLDGAATLIDLDASTASALVELPATVLWRADLGTLVVLPLLGTVLAPDHNYAAYLTSALHTDDDLPVAASAEFRAAVDLATEPDDAAVSAAQDSLEPLLEVLPAATRDGLIAATVFRTADFVNQTQRMRDLIAASPPTITVDAVFGPGGTALTSIFGTQTANATPGGCKNNVPRPQPSNHVAALVHGTMQIASFNSDTINVDGFPEYDVGGQPIVAGTLPVKFTLTLPVAANWDDLPVAIYVHGIGRTRRDLLTQANTAGRNGIAMIAIDLPYHGSRANRAVDQIDTINETTGVAGPDGFGDDFGLFPATALFHLGSSGGIPGYHPRAVGENLRQAAMELVSLVAFVRSGNDGPLETALAGLTGLPDTITFRDDVGLVTESLGAMVSGVALAVEPGLGVAYLSSPAAGFPDPAMLHSPNYAGTFAGAITGPYDIADRVDIAVPERDMRVDPMVTLFGNVVERGDALAYAPLVTSGALRGGTGPDLVASMAWGDVWVSNDTEEAYVRALGLPLSTMAVPTAPSQELRFVELTSDPWPVTGNLPGGKTGCFVVFNPAGHASLRLLEEERNFEPLFPPYTAITPPARITPSLVVEHQELWSELLAGHFAGGTVSLSDPFADADPVVAGTACP